MNLCMHRIMSFTPVTCYNNRLKSDYGEDEDGYAIDSTCYDDYFNTSYQSDDRKLCISDYNSRLKKVVEELLFSDPVDNNLYYTIEETDFVPIDIGADSQSEPPNHTFEANSDYTQTYRHYEF